MRKIFLSKTASARLNKFIAYHPELEKTINKILKTLKEDIYSPSLRIHKLHGKLSTSYSCSINYYYRIIYSFNDELIFLESIGSHEDVY
jgi:addiction module RelE/StbE family toxin